MRVVFSMYVSSSPDCKAESLCCCQLADTGTQFHRDVFEKCSEMMKLVQDLPIPVIAQVGGK